MPDDFTPRPPEVPGTPGETGDGSLEEGRRAAFGDAVGRRARRRSWARRHRESPWFGLGMFGLVGWSVMVPTLIGIAIGAWLDESVGGTVSWTLVGLGGGLALGCLLAWFWVREESRRGEDRGGE